MNTEIVKFAATEESVGKVIDKADEFLHRYNCPEDTRRNIDVVLDEICGNIINYAYPDGPGEFMVRIHVEEKFSEFTIRDKGIPFNPLEVNTMIEIDQPIIGGVGLIIAKQLSDSIDYQYLEDENCLHFTKRWE